MNRGKVQVFGGAGKGRTSGRRDGAGGRPAIHGTTVLSNFDIFATAGAAFKAVLREFTAPANASGQIVITFTTVTDNATIEGIEVIPANPNASPTMATAASASPNPVTGTAAATFTKAGSYTFQVTVKDAGNLTVTSSVVVTVNQTLTSIAVSPASATIAPSATQQFTATARDQFATALAVQPPFTWTASSGRINTSGLYTAPATAGGPFTVSAQNGSVTGSASVTVATGNAAPTIATPAAASPSPVTDSTTALSVLGADDGGEANLTYTWATTGTRPRRSPSAPTAPTRPRTARPRSARRAATRSRSPSRTRET